MSVKPPETGTLLPPYRVLDLSGPEAVFCGKLLADYGVDVVRVEPPGGDPSRAPRSLSPPTSRGRSAACIVLFYNTNKRSITLDLLSERGRELFRRLVAQADVILESYPVGYMGLAGAGL